MNYAYITVPLVGATIGYCTNWIAIKMLFKPYEEKRILNIKVPFTPGIIPKERERIAYAMGEVIEKYLITDEVIINELTSLEIEEKITNYVYTKTRKSNNIELAKTLESYIKDDLTVEDLLGEEIIGIICSTISENGESIKTGIVNLLESDIVASKIKEIISKTIMNKFGALGAMFANTDSIYNQIIGVAKDEITDQSLVQAINYLMSMAYTKKIDSIIDKENRLLIISSIIENIGDLLLSRNNVNEKKKVIIIYDKLVEKYIKKIIKEAKISSIVEKQINSFEINILEDMLLSIVNKELKAITMLGGLLGFIMSIIILFF